MKLGLIVVVTLIIGSIGSTLLLQDPGYVIINFRSYIIEMSVPALLAGILLILFIAWLCVKLFRAPRKLGEVAGRYRSGRAGTRLTQGVIEVAEGNFAKGEKLLSKAASVSDAPLLNYLQAARAAHLLGQDERRDRYLRDAYEHSPGAANAVLLTQAELQLDQEQYEQALATLRKIEDNAPNHAHALVLLGRLYFRLEDWENLAELIPKLKKHGRLDAETLTQWELRVQDEHLRTAADHDALQQAWKNVAKPQRKNIDLLESYYENLIRVGEHEKAEKDIAADLRREWRAPLVRLYGEVEGEDSTKQLKKAESWLKNRGDDADLLLTAAQLCLRNELWGKARSYLETVLAIRPTPEAYQEYGRLLNGLGEGDAASDAYRAGLGLVAGSALPSIPHLDAGLVAAEVVTPELVADTEEE